MEKQPAKILIVDDEPYVAELVARYLRMEGHQCATANSGEEALILLQEEEFHLAISDIMMPGMSGIDLLTMMKPLFPDTAMVMVTAVDDRQTALTALDLGAYGYVVKPFDRNEIVINATNALERRRLNILSRNYEEDLRIQVDRRTREVRDREEEIVLRLLSATGYRDDESGAHVRRIGLYAQAMAESLGWGPESAHSIRVAAPMHDVGKVGIPDTILRKPGPLTLEEFDLMKKHTLIGGRILEGSQAPILQMARDIALWHHERWDGAGYPEGRLEDAIPESALIVAVVDVYDALVHERVYRPALSEDEALAVMIQGNGDHFGPRVFECFLSVLPELRRIRQEVVEHTPPPEPL
jgi:putative two-component system response regulator